METLRFLMVTTFYPPYHLGGDAVHVQYLAEALASRGHEVHVEFAPAAYRLKRRTPPTARAPETAVRVHAIPSAFGRAQPLGAYVAGRSGSVTRFHQRLAGEVRPDVVHLHNISLLGLGVAGRVRGAAMVYTAHDYWARCPRSDLLKYGRRPCDRAACVACAVVSRRPPQLWRYGRRWRGLPDMDCAIAPSRFMAHAIAPSLACPVVHLPNFAPDPNPTRMPSEPGGYYLFVGVLERHKGLPELAAAACAPGTWRAKIVGSGSLHRELAGRAREAGSRIDLEGWVSRERLQDLYRNARALLVPSTWDENAPLAAIEALAWGAPLLTSLRGGLGELLHEGAAGRAFEPTPRGLRAAIDAFEQEGCPEALRPSARAAYEAHHRPEVYVPRYLDVVRGVHELPRDPVPEALARTVPPTPAIPSPGGGAP